MNGEFKVILLELINPFSANSRKINVKSTKNLIPQSPKNKHMSILKFLTHEGTLQVQFYSVQSLSHV